MPRRKKASIFDDEFADEGFTVGDFTVNTAYAERFEVGTGLVFLGLQHCQSN
jgi:hypothetical protein